MAGTLRRSSRLAVTDLNGRGYLADILSWPVQRLEEWVKSDRVHPHLVRWFNIAVKCTERKADVAGLIDNGQYHCQPGKTYKDRNLEEDTLLICLMEGEASARFEDTSASTLTWPTEEIWARTAWRIVHENKEKGGVFEHTIKHHPTSCYAFVIDVLLIAFHSIYHRGVYSCYYAMITGIDEYYRRAHSVLLGSLTSDIDFDGYLFESESEGESQSVEVADLDMPDIYSACDTDESGSEAETSEGGTIAAVDRTRMPLSPATPSTKRMINQLDTEDLPFAAATADNELVHSHEIGKVESIGLLTP
ncbi:hypothetical protein H2203_004564 [Taxawa tesnikishii (nom. ined.)]|nr:hypothetical protein H2203_004564 [Dothideales sp. JES 119]